MIKNILQNAKKGFTLIETLLVIGVFSLLSIGVYSTYRIKYQSAITTKQADYIVQIINGINQNLMTVDTNAVGVAGINAVINSTDLISQGLIPNEMILDPNNVKNLWDGQVTFTGAIVDITNDAVVNPVPVYSMTLQGIPPNVCAKLIANSKLIENTQEVRVNGVMVKQGGVSNIIPGALGVLCVNPLNTIFVSAATVKPGIAPIVTTNAAGSLRAKETKYYIATAGTNAVTLGPTACAVGTVWNATSSSCNCPGGSEWNGTRCVPYNSNAVGDAGFCQLGQRWNLQAAQCENIPAGVPGSYLAGRQIPSTIITPPQITATSITALSCATPTTKPASAPVASNPAGNFDGKICNKCTVGTWNGDRCVAP